jgi:hypothetical protein
MKGNVSQRNLYLLVVYVKQLCLISNVIRLVRWFFYSGLRGFGICVIYINE